MGQYDRKAQSQPKHGKPSSSGASKAGPPIPVNRPEWRGPAYVRKKPARQQIIASKEAYIIQEQRLSIKSQQTLLNIFRTSIPIVEEIDKLKPLLHDINQCLIKGDIKTALNTQQRRECYAFRWPPGRCLAYANILLWMFNQNEGNPWIRSVSEIESRSSSNIICFGSSVAATMALIAVLRHTRPDLAGKPRTQPETQPTECPPNCPVLRVHLLDDIDWSSILWRMMDVSTQPPTLTKYASANAIATNAAFIEQHAIDMVIKTVNPIDMDITSLSEPFTSTADVFMLCFFDSLGGYFRESIVKTTTMLHALTRFATVGSILIIIDQISTMISIPIAEKNFKDCPMSELLDQILIGKAQSEDTVDEPRKVLKWKKLLDEKVREHRIHKAPAYPASLDNLKFQCLVYERVSRPEKQHEYR